MQMTESDISAMNTMSSRNKILAQSGAVPPLAASITLKRFAGEKQVLSLFISHVTCDKNFSEFLFFCNHPISKTVIRISPVASRCCWLCAAKIESEVGVDGCHSSNLTAQAMKMISKC